MDLVLLPSVAYNCCSRYGWVLSVLRLYCLFKALTPGAKMAMAILVFRGTSTLTHASTLVVG